LTNHGGGPLENKATAFQKVTFVFKTILVGGASLDSFFKASWLNA